MSFASEIRGTHVASHASFARAFGRSRDFIALTKPRVMSLAVFTALVGLMLAPEHPNPLTGLVAILCIAAGAGAAGALNMWYDADIDAVMARTALRPIPRGRLSRGEALCFGLVLAAGAILILALATNVAAAALLAATILFYVVVYTMWLKRRTPQNIVIGGAAGACPPLIGWLAAGGPLALEPLLLTLIIFLWTPPHFWALSLNRAGEYTRAGVPMLPVVAGKAATKRQISDLLFPPGRCRGTAVGVWRGRNCLRCDLQPFRGSDDRARDPAGSQPLSRRAAGAALVRLFDPLSVRPVRGAACRCGSSHALNNNSEHSWMHTNAAPRISPSPTLQALRLA